MSSLVDALQRFNRKERNWLLRDALGASADVLCPNFRDRLAQVLGKPEAPISVPDHAWWATDFHIDWLIGAMALWREEGKAFYQPRPNKPGFVTGNQQDIDLLIAWDTTLVLIEAKGVGSWSGTGTRAKLQRLKNLPEFMFAGIRPFLVFISPDCKGVPKENLPSWILNGGSALHMTMKPPETGLPLLQIERCKTGSNGKPKRAAANDQHWRIRKAKKLPKSGITMQKGT